MYVDTQNFGIISRTSFIIVEWENVALEWLCDVLTYCPSISVS